MKLVLQFAQCRGKDFCLSGYTAAQSPSLDKSLAGIEPWAVEVIGGPLVRFSQQVQSFGGLQCDSCHIRLQCGILNA